MAPGEAARSARESLNPGAWVTSHVKTECDASHPTGGVSASVRGRP